MKRPGDATPDPPGGRAAERLRMFEDARRPPDEPCDPDPKAATRKKTTPGKKKKPEQKGRRRNAKQARRGA
jgi:hypothetical protein